MYCIFLGILFWIIATDMGQLFGLPGQKGWIPLEQSTCTAQRSLTLGQMFKLWPQVFSAWGQWRFSVIRVMIYLSAEQKHLDMGRCLRCEVPWQVLSENKKSVKKDCCCMRWSWGRAPQFCFKLEAKASSLAGYLNLCLTWKWTLIELKQPATWRLH